MYVVHKSMTKSNYDKCIKGNYKDFIKLFNSVKWYSYENMFKGSLFGVDSKSEFHADIISFNGVGFICNNFITFFRVKRFVKEFIECENDIYPYKHNVIEKLTDRLHGFCYKIKIPVKYVDKIDSEESESLNELDGNDMVTLGQIRYHSCDGEPIFDRAEILVRNDLKSSPRTLAHEIGHYIGISKDKDRSESRAEIEAYNLCKSLLSNKEFEVVEKMLEEMFDFDLTN